MASNVTGRRSAKPQSDSGSRITRANSRGRPRDAGAAVDRRAQILEASARLFAEYGFESTSVRQIADEVHLLAGSLYHHFATKEDILHEIIRDPLERIVQDHVAISALPVDAEHKLVTSTILRFHRYVYEGQVHSIIQNDANFFRRVEDFAYVQAAKARSFQMQEAILREGMEAQLFHPNIDTYLMIGTFSRMVSSAAAWFRAGDIHSSNKPTSYSFDRTLDFYLDCILRMIRMPSRLEDPIPREVCEKLAIAN